MFPYEVILHIASFLNNPIDLRNGTNKSYINDLIKKYIISKEKWTPCKWILTKNLFLNVSEKVPDT